MASKKACFQINWLQEPQFNKWLDKVPNDNASAKCKLCLKRFSLSNMGRRALTSHMKSSKHIKLENGISKSETMQMFLKPLCSHINELPLNQDDGSRKPENSSVSSISCPSSEIQKKGTCTSLEKYKLRDEVTQAEILWCMNTVMQHNSLRNAECSVSLFAKMFPDSAIARGMNLHKDKISYSIIFGLATYFKNELKSSLKDNSNYVIGFDESVNKVAEKTQMDLSIRYWDEKTNVVKAHYLDSVFLHHAKAVDLLKSFKLGIQELDLSKILQISMDGPNVNWSFYKLLQNDISAILGPNGPKLLDLGSCGLHSVHGAFKTGIKSAGWNIIEFLRAVFNLFKMVPSRRGHYSEITESCLFPLRFCSVRWIENARVAKRCQDMLPALIKYVEAVKETDKEPACRSFKVVELCVQDKLLPAKLAFFQSFAEQLEPFLTEFQTDSPMVPFLHSSLLNIIKGVMAKFVKKEEIEKDKFYKTNVLEKENGMFKNLNRVKEIDLGYGTRSALRHCCGINDKQLLQFRKDVRSCFQSFVVKFQERSPLKYPLTEALSFLDPSNIAVNEFKACQNMRKALDIMTQLNIILPSGAEKADREFKEIISRSSFKFLCMNYERKKTRLDTFWVSELQSYDTMRDVVKKVLLLSHGNATLERGFSINKEILVENLKEESLIAQRMIFDSVCNVGGIEEFSSQAVPRKMIHSMRNAYSRYKEAEDHRRKTMSEKDRRAVEKRKALMEVKVLEAKKAKLMKDALQEAEILTDEIKKLQQIS